MIRNALVAPLGDGGQQRLLGGVFGVGPVAVAAGEQADDLRREFTQQVDDCPPVSHRNSAGGPAGTGRSSTAPDQTAISPHSSIARSSLPTSTIQKPMTDSLASA